MEEEKRENSGRKHGRCCILWPPASAPWRNYEAKQKERRWNDGNLVKAANIILYLRKRGKREREREGRHSYYNACACLVSIRFLISFFFFSSSFFLFDPTTVNLGEAVHFLLFLRPEDEWS